MKLDPTADTLFDNAKAYTEAASRLMGGDGVDAAVAPAFYLLVSFALELFLKSACMRAGATNEEVKQIGHDLHKAYLHAMEARQVPRYMTRFGELTLRLNQPHKTHVFRYTPDGPPIEVPDPRYCLEVLTDVINLCHQWSAGFLVCPLLRHTLVQIVDHPLLEHARYSI